MMPTLAIDRALDPAERFFWLLDRISGMNFVVFAELDGTLDTARLQTVLERAQAAHPLLRAAIISEGSHGLRFAPSDAPLRCETVDIADDNWQAAIQAELSHRFDLHDAPLLRCRYLYLFGGARSILALTFHHAIADGRSGTALLREILQAMTLPESAWRFAGAAHPAMHDAFPERFQWQELPQAAAEVAQQRKTDLKRYGKPSALPWLDSNAPQRIPQVARIELDADVTAHLLARCRAQGTTMHGAISAAQLTAMYRTLGDSAPHTLSLGSPADMRAHLARPVGSEGLGMFATLLFGTYRLSPEADFWETAREASGDLRRQLARGDGHLLYTLMQPQAFAPSEQGIAAFAGVALASPHTSMISNIGVVEEMDSPVPVRLVSFALCPVPYQLAFTAVSTYGGRLVINVATDAAKFAPARAAQFIAWLRNSLVAAAA
jgi:NRPS condensation-like uncharacterized protein